jgi:hypothetical protein
MKWIVRAVALVAALYLTLSAALAGIMLQSPDRFGQIMKHVPMALAWGVMPGRSIWLWARAGSLAVGDRAPDFTLPTHDHSGQVTLSSHRGARPVVLVFGSYT